MPCHLSVPNHYLNQYWLLSIDPLGTNFIEFQSKYDHFIQQNGFENVFCESSAILLDLQVQPQCSKWTGITMNRTVQMYQTNICRTDKCVLRHQDTNSISQTEWVGAGRLAQRYAYIYYPPDFFSESTQYEVVCYHKENAHSKDIISFKYCQAKISLPEWQRVNMVMWKCNDQFYTVSQYGVWHGPKAWPVLDIFTPVFILLPFTSL